MKRTYRITPLVAGLVTMLATQASAASFTTINYSVAATVPIDLTAALSPALWLVFGLFVASVAGILTSRDRHTTPRTPTRTAAVPTGVREIKAAA